MSPKIRADHLKRGAVVYVRQSTPGQIEDHRESLLRQRALAETAREMGFATIQIIDDDSAAPVRATPNVQASSGSLVS